MPYPERPNDKPLTGAKKPRASLALRIDHAAKDVNPLLIVVALGLMLLNFTLYIGLSVSRLPAQGGAWHAAPLPHQNENAPAAWTSHG